MRFLGIDTSNYTTSVALYDADSGELLQRRMPLPVAPGCLGLRQSDAVFLHIKQLPPLLESLFEDAGPLGAVGVSIKPRDAEGSYMPCFLAGEMAARSIAAALGIPVYGFSHQAGHIAAALVGIGNLGLSSSPFLAFHVSGGTTECLLVTPGTRRPFNVKILARTLDLNAGQVIDRVGGMLGCGFPAGPGLEKLAASSARKYYPRPVLKGSDCCLSGLENQCRALLEKGEAPEDVALYCQNAVGATILAMAQEVSLGRPDLPFVFAGGVMGNACIRSMISASLRASFAPPGLSSDNAAGTAALCSLRHGESTSDNIKGANLC